MTKVMNCNCVSDFQDKTYGENKRVFNRMGKMSGSDHYYRCTVCKTERTKGDSSTPKKKK